MAERGEAAVRPFDFGLRPTLRVNGFQLSRRLHGHRNHRYRPVCSLVNA